MAFIIDEAFLPAILTAHPMSDGDQDDPVDREPLAGAKGLSYQTYIKSLLHEALAHEAAGLK